MTQCKLLSQYRQVLPCHDVVNLGRDEPYYSIEPSGKLVYTRIAEVLSANLQGAAEDKTPEGQRIPLFVRELGMAEIFATSLQHSPNGRLITVVGDGSTSSTPSWLGVTRHSAAALRLRQRQTKRGCTRTSRRGRWVMAD